MYPYRGGLFRDFMIKLHNLESITTRIKHIIPPAIKLAGLAIGTVSVLYSIGKIPGWYSSIQPFLVPYSSSSTNISSVGATPLPDIDFPPLTATPSSPYPQISDSTPTPSANGNGGIPGTPGPESLEGKLLTPTPDDPKGNGNPPPSIDNIVLTPTPNPEGDEGGPVVSSIDAAKRVSLAPSRGIQAGFLSPEVTSYSASGYGGIKASLPKPSSALNYFYLMIEDSKGKLVKFSPYDHSTKYTLMQMSHSDEASFVWDNSQLQPGKYTALILQGPQILFNDSKLQILEQREFDVKPYDFGANNAQKTFSDGYSINATNGLLTVLAPANKRFGIDLIDVVIYGPGGNIIWEENTLITDKYQWDFKSNNVPRGSYRAEAIVTHREWDSEPNRDVDKQVVAILAAQFSIVK